MPKLTRYLQKIFANNSNEVGVFGTGVDKETSKNVETLQSADYEEGWSSAIITNKNYPIWQEMDGVQYGLSYQLKYLFQNGIPEWLSTETYYENSYCRIGSTIYYSLQDNNTNHNPALNDGYWTPLLTSNRSIGEIVPSTIPLTEAGLHLLDGSLLSNGIYADFITYIANLTATAPDCFCTEVQWQSAVATYGVCSKFVYDSVNNTVRLPKWGAQAFTKTPSITTASTVPVRGNGMSLGLTDGTLNVALGTISATSGAQPYTKGFGLDVGEPYASSLGTLSLQKSLGVTTNSAKSGMVANTSSLLSITNYPLNCYYYIVIATSTKTNIQVDIDEIATDLNGKADTDLTNLSATQSTNFDGQWIISSLALANNVSIPNTAVITYDLSSYLPNDGHLYEVSFNGATTTDSTSGHALELRIHSDISGNVRICGCQTRTASTMFATGNCIIPVGTGRSIIVARNSSWNGTFYLDAIAYRRIGTNS